jgi:hypothetical protein
MLRTQIQLPEGQVSALKHLALQQHVSMAELIRRAIDLFTASPETGNLQERQQRALAAAGRFHSGQNDIASKHDDYLAEAFK